jgi:hypothetical protein
MRTTVQKDAVMNTVLSVSVIMVWALAIYLMREVTRARSPEEARAFQDYLAVAQIILAALGLLFMAIPRQ